MDRTLLSSDGINGDDDTIPNGSRGHSRRFLRQLSIALTLASTIYVAMPLTALVWTWICDILAVSQPTWFFEHHAWLASQFGFLLIFTVIVTAFVINRRSLQPLKARNIYLMMMSCICGLFLQSWMILYTSIPSWFISTLGCSITHWLVNICYPGLALPYLIRSIRLHLVFKWYGVGGRDPAIMDNMAAAAGGGSGVHGAAGHARFASRSVTPAPGTPLRTPRGSISHFPWTGPSVTASGRGIAPNAMTANSDLNGLTSPIGSLMVPSRSVDFFGPSAMARHGEPEWTIGSLQGAPAAIAANASRSTSSVSAAVKIIGNGRDDGTLTSESWSQSASPYLLPSRSTDAFSAVAGTSPEAKSSALDRGRGVSRSIMVRPRAASDEDGNGNTCGGGGGNSSNGSGSVTRASLSTPVGYMPPLPVLSPLTTGSPSSPTITNIRVQPHHATSAAGSRPKPLALPSSPSMQSLPSSPSATQLYPRSPSRNGGGAHGFGFGGTGSDMPRSYSSSVKDGLASPFLSGYGHHGDHSMKSIAGDDEPSSRSRYCTDGYIALWIMVGMLPFIVFSVLEEIYQIEASPTFLACSTQLGAQVNTPALAGSIVFHVVEALVLLVSLLLVWKVWDEFNIRGELIAIFILDAVIAGFNIWDLATDIEDHNDRDYTRYLMCIRCAIFFIASMVYPLYWSFSAPVPLGFLTAVPEPSALGTIEGVLANVASYDVFSKFMLQENGIDLLSFFVKADLYRDIEEEDELYDAARRIYHEFFVSSASVTSSNGNSDDNIDMRDGAPSTTLALLLPSLTIKEIEDVLVDYGRPREPAAMSVIDRFLFDKAKDYILAIMKRDYFPFFQRSLLYRQLKRDVLQHSAVRHNLFQTDMVEAMM